jgi:apolipoprotein N-acyltransferase
MQIYLVIAILALFIIAGLVFLVRGKQPAKKITPLAGLAFGFVIAGICFGENRWIGYGLMGVGVVLAVIDIFMKSNKEGKS